MHRPKNTNRAVIEIGNRPPSGVCCLPDRKVHDETRIRKRSATRHLLVNHAVSGLQMLVAGDRAEPRVITFGESYRGNGVSPTVKSSNIGPNSWGAP